MLTAEEMARTVAAIDAGIFDGLMDSIYRTPYGKTIHRYEGFNPCAYRNGQLIGEFLPNDGQCVMWFDQYGNAEAGSMRYGGLFDRFDPPMHRIATAEDVIGWLPIPEESDADKDVTTVQLLNGQIVESRGDENYETIPCESQSEETEEVAAGLDIFDSENRDRK